MSTEKNLKIEIELKTIQAIGTLCELSGLDIPDTITAEFIESASKRIKDIILSLKNQGDQANAQVEDLKKEIQNLKKQLEDSKSKKDEKTEDKQKERPSEEAVTVASDPNKPVGATNIQNILIIANLGVIMHQLKILFAKFGCKVTLVKSYSEAIGELKQQGYDCIIFDMTTNNENELMVIEALKKATEICNTKTLLVLLALPTKDKNMFKKLKSKGADIIIEKQESWHMNIIKELKLAS